MNKKTLYYICKDGSYIDDFTVKRSFLITHGLDARENEGAYIKFLWQLLDSRTLIFDPCPTVEKLWNSGGRLMAIHFYREENGCTLAEARKTVEEMMEKST